MVARVDPPRPRAPERGSGEASARYPGLTAEERGYDPSPLVPPTVEPPPPLWVAPAEVPESSRSSGFFGPAPEAVEPEPVPEGLFDVPGLLERLWLARALEARQERPWTAYVARSAAHRAAPTTPPTSPATVAAPAPAATPPPAASPPPAPAPSARAPAAPPTSPSRSIPSALAPLPPTPAQKAQAALWSSWICPQCYLTNDHAVDVCRGCRRPAPRA